MNKQIKDRHFSFMDQLLIQFDQGVRTLVGNYPTSERENPSLIIPEVDLTKEEREHAAGLMRVNHVGEICAQALYQGQALTARTEATRENMQQAAMEEFDHLAWCKSRLTELDSRTSYLNPFWYISSLSLGIIAGLAGDKWSLGFLAETERQVVKHLDKHLASLPAADQKSHAIVRQMREDEEKHAEYAIAAGANELPSPLKKIMAAMSTVMTMTAYRL